MRMLDSHRKNPPCDCRSCTEYRSMNDYFSGVVNALSDAREERAMERAYASDLHAALERIPRWVRRLFKAKP